MLFSTIFQKKPLFLFKKECGILKDSNFKKAFGAYSEMRDFR